MVNRIRINSSGRQFRFRVSFHFIQNEFYFCTLYKSILLIRYLAWKDVPCRKGVGMSGGLFIFWLRYFWYFESVNKQFNCKKTMNERIWYWIVLFSETLRQSSVLKKKTRCKFCFLVCKIMHCKWRLGD